MLVQYKQSATELLSLPQYGPKDGAPFVGTRGTVGEELIICPIQVLPIPNKSGETSRN